MRKLDTSQISVAARFFPKSGTLDHLQLAYQECVNAIIQAMIGSGYDPTKVYILFGCVNSGNAQAMVISAGAVFYNGEVYLVDAVNLYPGAGLVAIANYQLTYNQVNADPVTFTDNVQRNVHQIRKFQIVAGDSGLGNDGSGGHLPDFAAWVQANTRVSISGSAVSGQWPNYQVNLPANRILYIDTFVLGDPGSGTDPHGQLIPGSGTSTYNVTFPDLGTANYIVTGSMKGLGSPVLDAAECWSWDNPASNGFQLAVRDNSGGVQNLVFAFVIYALG